eukprot:COSAG01_NODE_25002_length_758_cov_31.162367_1_plen_156_part_10
MGLVAGLHGAGRRWIALGSLAVATYLSVYPMMLLLPVILMLEAEGPVHCTSSETKAASTADAPAVGLAWPRVDGRQVAEVVRMLAMYSIGLLLLLLTSYGEKDSTVLLLCPPSPSSPTARDLRASLQTLMTKLGACHWVRLRPQARSRPGTSSGPA